VEIHMRENAKTDRQTFATVNDLAQSAADWICKLALASEGRFAVCLSGGSTPRKLYEALAARGPDFPWPRSHWFWGDERFVPHDHPDSNFRLLDDAIFSRVAVPNGNIHAIPTAPVSPEQAAAAYERTLKDFYGAETIVPTRALFDVTLLGIGEDGHTASLFPGDPALAEDHNWAAAVIGAKSEARITLTYPVLDSSRDVAFLVTGEGKRGIVARAQSGDGTLPAARIRPVGRLHWFTDRAAGSENNAVGDRRGRRPEEVSDV
jgi:6-phosphogluconolactonase